MYYYFTRIGPREVRVSCACDTAGRVDGRDGFVESPVQRSASAETAARGWHSWTVGE